MLPKIVLFLIMCINLSISEGASTTRQVLLETQHSIQVQLGEHYSEKIPNIFEIYQSGYFGSFDPKENPEADSFFIINKTSAENLDPKSVENLCYTETITGSTFKSQEYVYHYGLADPNEFFIHDQSVFLFEDLEKLIGVLDVTEYRDQIVVIFQSGFYVFYEVHKQTGNLSARLTQKFRLTDKDYEGPKLKYGNFIKDESQNVLLYFSENMVLAYDDQQGTFIQVLGYQPIGYSFEKAILDGGNIYVADSSKGIFIYLYSKTERILQLQREIKPMLPDSSMKYPLIISDFLFFNKTFYISDSEEGIFRMRLPLEGENEVFCEEDFISKQHCQNLHIWPERQLLIATCPQLILSNLIIDSHQTIPEIELMTRSLHVNESRIYVFGEYQYGVFDVDAQLVEIGHTYNPVDFSISIGKWTVLINKYGIETNHIQAATQKLYCETSHEGIVAMPYSTNLTIEGICSEILSENIMVQELEIQDEEVKENLFNHLSTKDQQTLEEVRGYPENCQIIVPVMVNVTDSSVLSFFIQFIIIGVIIWIAVVGVIYYCVKDIKVEREYHDLQEEVTTHLDGKSDEIVLSAKSEDKQN